MRFIFFSPVHFEDWDWRNSVERGIGGSETSHVEMAWRLARRGHEVISYAPIPPDCPGEWRGTFWKRYEEADFTQDGLWVIYRAPEVLDKFGPRRPDQPRWLMCQDTWYPSMTPERAAKLDRVLALCQDHVAHLQASAPYLAEKLWPTSNGVKVDLVRELEARGDLPERNPLKLIYASSPDRGLVVLLDIFKRAKELVPDLELHVFYGMDNIEKLLAQGAGWAKASFAGLKANLDRLLRQPGVTWRGRVSQVELYREWLSAGIWCYPTDFTETSCITCHPPGARILTTNGLMDVETVQPGDHVLTHRGRIREVSVVRTRRYSGPLYSLWRRKDTEPLRLTEDHPVLVIRFNRGAVYREHFIRHRAVSSTTEWLQARDVQIGDFLATPALSADDGAPLPVLNIGPDRVTVTPAIAYVIGLFLAEGWTTHRNAGIYTAHHVREAALAEQVVALFGGTIRKRGNHIQTESYHRDWATRLREDCGQGARGKHLPGWIWTAPASVRTAMLHGMADGDGSRFEIPAGAIRRTYTTASRHLAYGFSVLMTAEGEHPSIQYVPARDSYEASWYEKPAQQQHVFHQGLALTMVRRISVEHYEGPVYNLDVEEDHSYLTDRTIVHNCMEAQALGAIPITRPLWALTDNVRHGIWLDGTPAMDRLVRARYVGEIYRLATTPGLQERLREPMMAWARSFHNWERWVDQWECTLLGLPVVPAQFCFQHKHARGRILNIGCASDPTGFMRRGAVNVDVAPTSPTGEPNAAHVLWDARTPFPALLGTFDTAILGDILEHMDGADRAAAVAAAAERLLPGGRLLITCPFDARPVAAQQAGATETMTYAPGVHAYHEDVGLTTESLLAACQAAGLQVERTETLDYNFADGIGVIARKP